ncbi:MAG TPA: DUF6010 family protein [Blastocatellia bacterium]|nr:DUF6010 family protein [Blastocatellia bacterium]
MGPTSSAIGLTVIAVLYISIGVMSAAGSVYISKSVFSAKAEQIFFGLFLIPIAGFYLAFTAHFGDKSAWQLEAAAVAVFSVFGIVGIRVPFFLIVGYLLHGLWDGVHEFNAHAGGSLLGPRQTTSVPLAYGFFCATYDFLMAAYFYTRRHHWHKAVEKALEKGRAHWRHIEERPRDGNIG